MQSACATLPSVACPLYNIFPHYLIKGTIFKKKLMNTKCVFGVSLQIFPETLLILGRTERDMVKNIHRSACTVLLFSSDINKFLFFSTDFLKTIKYQISRKSVTWDPRVPCGWTDRHDDGNSRFTEFCKRTKKYYHCQNWYRVPQVENCCTNTFRK